MKINSNLLMNGRICNVNLVYDNLSTKYYLWKQWREKGLRWLTGREMRGEGSTFELCKNERGREANHVREKKRVKFFFFLNK